MAAPSRSINYRTGAPVEFDATEFKALLMAMKQLPKKANDDLRDDAGRIAENIMKPIVIREILQHVSPRVAGPLIASIRVGRDRIPKLIIGKSSGPYYSGRKSNAGSMIGPRPNNKPRARRQAGQASSNMLRYGTIVGVYQRASGPAPNGRYFSRGESVNWPKNVVKVGWTTAASDSYIPRVYGEWQEAVRDVCLDWERGKYA
jgi:hypothetical protein